MFDSVLNTSFRLYNFSVICTVTLCYVLYQTHSKCWHIQHSVFQVYADIFNHIQRYRVLRHIHAYWDIIKAYSGFIQAYSAPCVALAYSWPCHIRSHGIFRIGDFFKNLSNFDQAYSETCHRALISHIQAYSELCATLAYAETLHTRNPGIFRTLL